MLATTCLPHISSSTVRISVKFGITGKVFSRRIQRRMLRRTRITPYGKRRQLPKLRHSDHSGDIWSMSNPDSSYLDVPPPAQDVLLQFGTDLGEIWGRNMTFTSRIPRVWLLLLWNWPVGLSFHLYAYADCEAVGRYSLVQTVLLKYLLY